MPNFREEVEQYVASRQKFLDLEDRFMGVIRVAFDREIPALNSKLPLDVNIGRYEVHPPERFQSRIPDDNRHKMPYIVIPLYAPHPTNSEVASFNRILADDYKRFEEQYGVIIQGFRIAHRVG